jgi:diguanylate cyclase (GGDEF)-like protein
MIHDLQKLFKEEVEELNAAKKICEEAKNVGSVSVEQFVKLVSSYERSLKAMMKITKISDCQQAYLQDKKEELQKELEEIKEIEEKLKYYAYTDPMTGVSNHRIGIMKLEEEVEKCLEEKSSISICYIDIDKLKNVNDNYGHSEGDFLINTIIEIIKEVIREVDTVSRMGGDEFMIIFPNYPYESAQQSVNEILRKIKIFNENKIKPYELSFSYGIEEINENTRLTNINEIIKIADELMYQDKMSKRDK